MTVIYSHGNLLPQYFELLPLFTNYKISAMKTCFEWLHNVWKSFCEFKKRIYIPSTSARRPLMEAGKEQNGRLEGGKQMLIKIMHIMWRWGLLQKGFFILLPPGTASNSVNSWENLAKSGSCKKICSTRAWSKVIFFSLPRSSDNYK